MYKAEERRKPWLFGRLKGRGGGERGRGDDDDGHDLQELTEAADGGAGRPGFEQPGGFFSQLSFRSSASSRRRTEARPAAGLDAYRPSLNSDGGSVTLLPAPAYGSDETNSYFSALGGALSDQPHEDLVIDDCQVCGVEWSSEPLSDTGGMLGRAFLRLVGFIPRHTVLNYVVQCKNGDFRWCVKQRYSSFYHMHQRLRNSLPADLLPNVPNKTLVRSSSPEFASRRLLSLNLYLQSLLRSSSVRRNRAFLSFMKPGPDGVEAISIERPLVVGRICSVGDSFEGRLRALVEEVTSTRSLTQAKERSRRRSLSVQADQAGLPVVVEKISTVREVEFEETRVRRALDRCRMIGLSNVVLQAEKERHLLAGGATPAARIPRVTFILPTAYRPRGNPMAQASQAPRLSHPAAALRYTSYWSRVVCRVAEGPVEPPFVLRVVSMSCAIGHELARLFKERHMPRSGMWKVVTVTSVEPNSLFEPPAGFPAPPLLGGVHVVTFTKPLIRKHERYRFKSVTCRKVFRT
ncbi:hypothetical protein DIPPA_35945 [Diplonema papillatum]|nr:hypothetical protein DIPPA_35945 [Diplonema papillatum]